jgi:hypothetical protein
MVLLLAVGLGILAGWAFGGRLSRLADLRLRAIWLFYVAIGLQIVAFPSQTLPWSVGDRLAIGLWLASYACLVVAAACNLRVRGAAVVGLGMASNLVAVLANGGHMPGLPSALRAAGHTYTGSHNNEVVASHPHLAWLVDRWAVPHWIPGGNVYSVGDVLIAVGAVIMVSAAMGGRIPLAGRLRRQQPLGSGLAGGPTSTP